VDLAIPGQNEAKVSSYSRKLPGELHDALEPGKKGEC
jgi:hypothetical protein